VALAFYLREDGAFRFVRDRDHHGVYEASDGAFYLATVRDGPVPLDRVLGLYETAEGARADYPRALAEAAAIGDARALFFPAPSAELRFVFFLRIPQTRSWRAGWPGVTRLDLVPENEATREFCRRRPVFFDRLRAGFPRGELLTKKLLAEAIVRVVDAVKRQWGRGQAVSVRVDGAEEFEHRE
jgi:hypothetical protein